jgi:hypothetical protein
VRVDGRASLGKLRDHFEENAMKPAILAAAILVVSAPAIASGLADPVVAPDVIAADASESSEKLDGLFTAIFAVLLLLNVAGTLN